MYDSVIISALAWFFYPASKQEDRDQAAAAMPKPTAKA